MKKLIIIGNSAFAEVAFEYFTHDSDYNVVAFSVNQQFLTKEELLGLPVVALENLSEMYPPEEYDVFTALTYGRMNRNRTDLYLKLKALGYKFATYKSSRAFIWKNVEIGENCFIFENNVVQPFSQIGNNTIIWSGNHIGHHSVIGNNVFISSHVVISGYVTVKDSCFLGVNSTISNNVTIEEDTWVGPGITIMKNTSPDSLFKPLASEASPISAKRFFKV